MEQPQPEQLTSAGERLQPEQLTSAGEQLQPERGTQNAVNGYANGDSEPKDNFSEGKYHRCGAFFNISPKGFISMIRADGFIAINKGSTGI